MPNIIDIINEEIMTSVANYPLFGDHLRSISEVGEGSSTPYQFKFENTAFNEVHYYFSTEEHDYDVQLNQTDPRAGVWMMQFGTVGGDVKDITNEGKPLKIMATITQITNDFIDRLQPNILQFKPEKDEDYEGDDKRRFNLYMAFIKKHMKEGYTVFKYGDFIVIKKFKPIKSNIPKI
jgi:hypothetical protein